MPVTASAARPSARGHRPFTLVLAGGGARGYAHVGVLRALEHLGLSPSGIVGVSMGAVVGATYALRRDWYRALLSIDLGSFPSPGHHATPGDGEHGGLRQALEYVHTAWNMVTGWGAPGAAVVAGNEVLRTLFEGRALEEARIPVVVCATDLRSGARVELASGPASEAVMASSALAGILPPVPRGDLVLADGVYSDVAPVDVARGLGSGAVIAVDPGQTAGAGEIRNGLQAVMRAMEICHLRHADLRLGEADLVIRPSFGRFIDVLDFSTRRDCVAAGARALRSRRRALAILLGARRSSVSPRRIDAAHEVTAEGGT